MEDGSVQTEVDFLAKNGLRYGKVYGFAIDMTEDGPTKGMWRDDFHRDPEMAHNGAKVPGIFTPIDWQWDGVVRDFIRKFPNHLHIMFCANYFFLVNICALLYMFRKMTELGIFKMHHHWQT